jgi:hypothetical protein
VIYPATYDITILQNATFKTQVRFTQERKQVGEIQGTFSEPVFLVPCHGRSAGDKVVFTGSVVCGIEENQVYYVLADGLTVNSFKISSSDGGASVAISETEITELYIATPVDLTGYTVDADIKELTGNTQVATFICSLPEAANGLAELFLSPSGTVALSSGVYGYDVSLTSGSGERYYWLTGDATVVATYSRN